MAVSHSFAGEHVEDGRDEKAHAHRDHHEIEHFTYLSRCPANPGNFRSGFSVNAEPGRSDADQSTAVFIQTRIASARVLSRSDTPNLRAPLHGSNALSTIRIREALTFCSIKAP